MHFWGLNPRLRICWADTLLTKLRPSLKRPILNFLFSSFHVCAGVTRVHQPVEACSPLDSLRSSSFPLLFEAESPSQTNMASLANQPAPGIPRPLPLRQKLQAGSHNHPALSWVAGDLNSDPFHLCGKDFNNPVISLTEIKFCKSSFRLIKEWRRQRPPVCPAPTPAYPLHVVSQAAFVTLHRHLVPQVHCVYKTHSMLHIVGLGLTLGIPNSRIGARWLYIWGSGELYKY